jgi:hydroxymethylbilane synthase
VSEDATRIATRASRLALWQANDVAGRLRAVDPRRPVELVEVSTVGDRDRSQPLDGFGGFGVFTREVQRAVLDGRADVAVHSLKDLPTEPVDGLTLAAVPPRASCFDVLVLGPDGAPAGDPSAVDAAGLLQDLPDAARLGTGSLRRKAQLLHVRPDLQIENVRGNVETRLDKLDAGEFQAIVLAEAGLQRLGLADRISGRFAPPALFPAVGQGALGIECRSDDSTTLELLQSIDDAETRARVTAERALLFALRAGCHAPVGAATSIDDGGLRLHAVVLSADGRERIQVDVAGGPDEASSLGRRAAEKLRRLGADRLMGRGW